MATYDEWNNALLQYIIAGLPRGARVFLAVDDEAIEFLANQLKSQVDDFVSAIRLRCIRRDSVDLQRIYSPSISGNSYDQAPRYLTFLGLMVLAAHNMGKEADQGIAKNDYFYYLNVLLGLPSDAGRPSGMKHGAEVELWKDWNIWLRYQGFQPTAPTTLEPYYKIALTQALLRQSDKDNLWRHLSNNDSKYPDHIGKDGLISRLRSDKEYGFTRQLRDLLTSEGKVGSQRYDDLADEIYDVFEGWIDSGKQAERSRVIQGAYRSTLNAGLYRVVNYLTREVQYHLLPKQPRHIHLAGASLEYQSETELLVEQRPGWFEPLPWPLSIEDIENGIQASIKDSERIRQLILPQRNFWILPPDPEDSASGIFATWTERPELGIPFVMLCKKELETDLRRLKEDGLIDWKMDPRPIDSNWLEYEEIVVIGDAWSSAIGEHKELIGQLRPRNTIAISLHGGLRDPQSGVWIVGYGPEITINTFFENVQIEILTTTDEFPLMVLDVKAGETVHYNWSESGNFQLRVTAGAETIERRVTIVEWAALTIEKSFRKQPILFGSHQIWGAHIEEL